MHCNPVTTRKWVVLWLILITRSCPALDPGSLVLPSETSDRLVNVGLAPPPGAYWVKLSAFPDFREGSNGIAISITSVGPETNYMDLSIHYPKGTTGGHGRPGGLASGQKNLRVLVIPTRLADGGEPPSFATFDWMERLMFSTNSGPDARMIPNSVKVWHEQNSYGRVTVTGEVYPQWVRVGPAAHYTPLDVYTIPQILIADAVSSIEATDAAFFATNTFDFVIVLMPGDLTVVYGGYPYEQSGAPWDDPQGHFRGYLLMDLPVGTNSIYRNPIVNEHAVSTNPTNVNTRFDIAYQGITGVWLASDPQHLGMNYFSGGSAQYFTTHVTLGTALPQTNVEVLITYRSASYYQLEDESAPLFSSRFSQSWFGSFLHELAHGTAAHITMGAADYLGDLYHWPAQLILDFSLMATGDHNFPYDYRDYYYSEPCHFDAYTKYRLGWLAPYTLLFGQDEPNLRLFPAEEYPYTGNTKLVKVPLQSPLESGRWQFPYGGPDQGQNYRGEEYLLLEIRRNAEVPGFHNFDSGLFNSGLFIYHVLEADPGTIGNYWESIVRIEAAEPEYYTIYDVNYGPSWDESISVLLRAPFGPDTGVFSYVQSDPWQIISTNPIPLLLPTNGLQTVYAKFKDVDGNQSPTISAPVYVFSATVSISDASIKEGNSGTTGMVFNVALSPPSGHRVQVSYQTRDITATAGVDYSNATGVVVFPPGTTNQTIMVSVRGDTAIELDETFAVDLSSPTNAGLANNEAIGTIFNDDGVIGSIDHFEWGPLPTIAYTDVPMSASLSSRDYAGTLISQFNHSVALTAAASISHEQLRILRFTGAYEESLFSNVLGAVLTNFTLTSLTNVGLSGIQLSQALSDEDIFLIPPQNTPYWQMSSLGASWSAALRDFLDAGGTLLVCGSSAEPMLLAGSGLMDVSSSFWACDSDYVAPNRTVLNQGLDVFYYKDCVLTFSNTDAIASIKLSGASAPAAVLSKQFGKGQIILIGFPYFPSFRDSPGFNLVLANAVHTALGRRTFKTPLPVQPASSGAFRKGLWTGQVTVISPGTNVILQADDGNGHLGRSNPINVYVDRDHDGMPDDWELANGLNPNFAGDGSLDADGDGLTNYQEFLAGTDPNSPASALRLNRAIINGGTVGLAFLSAPGRNYRIEYSADLSSASWTALRDLGGTGGLIITSDTLPANPQGRFYRLVLLP